jgi:phage protein U
MSLYAVLNDVELEIITWLDGLSMRYGAEYAEQGLIGRKSLLQYTGHRPDEVKIDARLHAQWCNPADEVRRIKDKMDAKEPVAFVLGTGEYRGVFVITEAEVTTTQTDGFGAAIAFELSITLREYVGDPAQPNPPGVVTSGYRIPIETATVDDFVLIEDAPLSSPGGIAQMAADGLSAIARGVALAADVASFVALAQSHPASALLALPGLADAVSAFGATIPVEGFDALRGVAAVAADAMQALSAFQSARNRFDVAAIALGGGLSGVSSALWSVRAGAQALEGARDAVGRIAATAASRLPVEEVWV